MASLTLKNLPDELLRALHDAAERIPGVTVEDWIRG